MERETERETDVEVLLNNGERDRERETEVGYYLIMERQPDRERQTEVEILFNNGETERQRWRYY